MYGLSNPTLYAMYNILQGDHIMSPHDGRRPFAEQPPGKQFKSISMDHSYYSKVTCAICDFSNTKLYEDMPEFFKTNPYDIPILVLGDWDENKALDVLDYIGKRTSVTFANINIGSDYKVEDLYFKEHIDLYFGRIRFWSKLLKGSLPKLKTLGGGNVESI